MERCVINNKHGPWLRPPTIMLEKLLDKRFEESGISGSFENTRRNDTVLSIGRQYLEALAPMEFRHLDWCHAEW